MHTKLKYLMFLPLLGAPSLLWAKDESPLNQVYSLEQSVAFYHPGGLQQTSTQVPGGLAVMVLDEHSKDCSRVSDVSLGGEKVSVREEAEGCTAYVPLALSTKEGTHTISFLLNGQSKEKAFLVSHKSYPFQEIHVAKRYVAPPKGTLLRRIEKERIVVLKALAVRSPAQESLEFIAPSPKVVPVSGNFGNYRTYNGQTRPGHNGLDLALKEGSQVRAVAAGRVVLAGDLFYSGKTIILDHGDGLFSLYFHLSKIDLKGKKTLKMGEPIGLVGHTGRATGPHLHLGLKWNGVYIDPVLFLPDLGGLEGALLPVSDDLQSQMKAEAEKQEQAH